MLVLQRPDGWFADREALSVWLQRPVETIRKRCPVASYHDDGRALYDMGACEAILRDLQRRSGSS